MIISLTSVPSLKQSILRLDLLSLAIRLGLVPPPRRSAILLSTSSSPSATPQRKRLKDEAIAFPEPWEERRQNHQKKIS